MYSYIHLRPSYLLPVSLLSILSKPLKKNVQTHWFELHSPCQMNNRTSPKEYLQLVHFWLLLTGQVFWGCLCSFPWPKQFHKVPGKSTWNGVENKQTEFPLAMPCTWLRHQVCETNNGASPQECLQLAQVSEWKQLRMSWPKQCLWQCSTWTTHG